MQTLLNQLQDDEALLMMYAADELSAEDRARVERRLAEEPALREQLESVRELSGSIHDAIGELDGGSRLHVSEGVAVRKVARVMRQWQYDRMAPPPPEAPEDQLRFPWWSYPLATAAAVLLAFLVWWGQQDGPPEQRVRRWASSPESSEMERPLAWGWDDEMARRLRQSLYRGFESNGLQFDNDAAWVFAEEPQIDDVEGIFMTPLMTDERIQ